MLLMRNLKVIFACCYSHLIYLNNRNKDLMTEVILGVYITVALLGIYLLLSVLLKRRVRLLTGIIHGVLGLAGIALLITRVSFSEENANVTAILLFFLAFLVGGGIFSAKVFLQKSGKLALAIHIALALAGLFFLFTRG